MTTGGEHRRAMGWDGAEFGRILRVGMDSNGWSRASASKKLGISPTSLNNYLGNAVIPSMEVLSRWSDYAEVCGISEEELALAVGILPSSVAINTSLRMATRKFKEDILRSTEIMLRATPHVTASRVATVVDKIIESQRGWEMKVKSATRGHETVIVYHHYISLTPASADSKLTRVQLKYVVQNEILNSIWGELQLCWRESPIPDWPDESINLVIQVPEFESTREPVEPSERLRNKSIVVLAPPWSYGELIASLLADVLGFGNLDLRYSGPELHDGSRRRYVLNQLAENRKSYVASIPSFDLARGVEIPREYLDVDFLVVVRVGDTIIMNGPTVREELLKHEGREPRETVKVAQRRISEMSRNISATTRLISVEIHDNDFAEQNESTDSVVGESSGINIHSLNDIACRLARRIFEIIRNESGLPYADPGGVLRDTPRIGMSGKIRQYSSAQVMSDTDA